MQKENQNTEKANYADSFAFNLAGCLLAHDKRLFQTIQDRMNYYMPFLLEHSFFDHADERMDFFNLMESINALAEIQKSYSNKQLKKIYTKLGKRGLHQLGKEAKNV